MRRFAMTAVLAALLFSFGCGAHVVEDELPERTERVVLKADRYAYPNAEELVKDAGIIFSGRIEKIYVKEVANAFTGYKKKISITVADAVVGQVYKGEIKTERIMILGLEGDVLDGTGGVVDYHGRPIAEAGEEYLFLGNMIEGGEDSCLALLCPEQSVYSMREPEEMLNGITIDQILGRLQAN